MIRILFVDDEITILKGLRRMLHPMRREWDMHFTNSGKKALLMLCEQKYDVIVCDMRMPGMDGIELLSQVMKTYPKMIRLVLSGHAEVEKILESARVAHQYLAKPCDADTLINSIERACSLRELFANHELESVLGGIETLPSLPRFYKDLMDEIADPCSDFVRVGEIISKDVSMSMKIMQLVNSAFFTTVNHISSPVQAVAILGLNTIKGLAIITHAFSVLDASVSGVDMEELWEHSGRTAALAARIAALECKDKRIIDHAFIGGLLHDVGKLVLANCMPEHYLRAVALQRCDQLDEIEAQCQVFGCSHAEIGAYLINLWGFANPIVEALAFHHLPGQSVGDSFTPLTAVYLAEVLLQQMEDETYVDGQAVMFDEQHIQRIRKEDQIPLWIATCQAFLLASKANK